MMADTPSPSFAERTMAFMRRKSKAILTMNVVLVIINLFVFVMQGSKRPVDLWMFDSIMDSAARSRFDSLLHTFTSLMDQHNITYFMYQGTLLGSYRHHGHMRWDDDIDFMLNVSDRPKVKEITEGMGIKYAYYNRGPVQVLKFFVRKSPYLPAESEEKDVTWPHVDVSFYVENDTHIWDPAWAWMGYVFHKSEVFPLVKRPFDGLILPAPRDAKSVLSKTYDMNVCRTHMFNHKLFVVIPYFLTAEKQCDSLRDRVPFVHRTVEGCKVTERLKLHGWTIQEFNTTLPCDKSIGKQNTSFLLESG